MQKLLMKRKRQQWINCLHGKGFFSLSSLLREYSEKLKSKEEKKENGFNSKIICYFQKPTFTTFPTLFNRGGRCRGVVSKKTYIVLHSLHEQELGGFIIIPAKNDKVCQGYDRGRAST
jgi:hypothetical protein